MAQDDSSFRRRKRCSGKCSWHWFQPAKAGPADVALPWAGLTCNRHQKFNKYIKINKKSIAALLQGLKFLGNPLCLWQTP